MGRERKRKSISFPCYIARSHPENDYMYIYIRTRSVEREKEKQPPAQPTHPHTNHLVSPSSRPHALLFFPFRKKLFFPRAEHRSNILQTLENLTYFRLRPHRREKKTWFAFTSFSTSPRALRLALRAYLVLQRMGFILGALSLERAARSLSRQ